MSQHVFSSALAVLAGLLQAASVALPGSGQPQPLWQVVSLALLVAALQHGAGRSLPSGWRLSAAGRGMGRRATGWTGFWLGWLFALAWLAGTFWWLFISMHTYGGLAAPLAVLAVAALAAALALFYGMAAAVFVQLYKPLRQVNAGFSAIVFASLWTLAELARGSWFTGFPWGAGGYAHVDGPLAVLPRWVGVYGAGWVAAFVAALLAGARGWRLTALRRHGRRVLLWGAGTALVWGGLWWVQQAATAPGEGRTLAPMAVALLQGNIPQDEKFQPGLGLEQSIVWYGQQLQASQAPLVVAPETALPVLPPQLPDGYWAALLARFGMVPAGQGGEHLAAVAAASAASQAALIGIPLGDALAGYTNTVVGLRPGLAVPYRYDKHHLVPFGEFIPWGFQWFVRMMNIPLGDFNRGPLQAPSFEWQGQRLAPNICYEDLFGQELAQRFADPAQAPTALVNVSNIGWFGDSIAVDQHLQISRMRALELERPMLRATNTGATAIIDPRGRVMHQLPRHTRGVLLGQFEGRVGRITPYAAWVSRLGLAPLWGLCIAIVLVASFAFRSSRRA